MGKLHMQAKPSKDDETLNNVVIIGICTLLVLIIFNTGCFEISDWEYEYYYYIEIQSNSPDNYVVNVPLPHQYSEYIRNLKIEKGNCTYTRESHYWGNSLRINGSSSISIFSSFTTWDSFIDFEIGDGNLTTIYSNNHNITIIVDSRAVRKTNEEETWVLYYSAVINPDMDFPIPNKQTWKNHLPGEYFIHPEAGWHLYPIKEEGGWYEVLIK